MYVRWISPSQLEGVCVCVCVCQPLRQIAKMFSSVLTLLVLLVRMKPETFQQDGAGVHYRNLRRDA